MLATSATWRLNQHGKEIVSVNQSLKGMSTYKIFYVKFVNNVNTAVQLDFLFLLYNKEYPSEPNKCVYNYTTTPRNKYNDIKYTIHM